MPYVTCMAEADGRVLCYPMQKKTDWEECKENLKLNTGYLLEGA